MARVLFFDYIIHDSMFAVDVYLLKFLSFLQSILVLLSPRQKNHPIILWNNAPLMYLKI